MKQIKKENRMTKIMFKIKKIVLIYYELLAATAQTATKPKHEYDYNTYTIIYIQLY